MTDNDKAILKAEYPEAPKWVLDREWSLDEARETMELRRFAFPATK